MNAKVAHLNWNNIQNRCRGVAHLIESSGFTPEIVVGIQRGGCVPAVFLSHLLNVQDFCTLGLRTTTSEDIQASRQTPIVTDDSSLHLVAGKHVLLVDDVTNTGATLLLAKKRILKFGCRELRTAVVAWDTTDIQPCQADYYGTRVDVWVVFPWEK